MGHNNLEMCSLAAQGDARKEEASQQADKGSRDAGRLGDTGQQGEQGAQEQADQGKHIKIEGQPEHLCGLDLQVDPAAGGQALQINTARDFPSLQVQPVVRWGQQVMTAARLQAASGARRVAPGLQYEPGGARRQDACGFGKHATSVDRDRGELLSGGRLLVTRTGLDGKGIDLIEQHSRRLAGKLLDCSLDAIPLGSAHADRSGQ